MFLYSPRILMVMDLMEGGELFELVRSKRRFTEKEAVNFTKQVSILTLHLTKLLTTTLSVFKI